MAPIEKVSIIESLRYLNVSDNWNSTGLYTKIPPMAPITSSPLELFLSTLTGMGILSGFVITVSLYYYIKEGYNANIVKRETHKKKCKFIGKVLNELPFLYADEKVQNFHWELIANQLTDDDSLPEFLCYPARFNDRFVFGSLANHLKYSFYKLMEENSRGTPVELNTERLKLNEENLHNVPEFRTKPISRSYNYFTPDEIKSIIISSIDSYPERNYNQQFLSAQEIAELPDYYYDRFGYLYFIGAEDIRTLQLEFTNLITESRFLKLLMLLRLSQPVHLSQLNGDIGGFVETSRLITKRFGLVERVLIDEARENVLDKMTEMQKDPNVRLEAYFLGHPWYRN